MLPLYVVVCLIITQGGILHNIPPKVEAYNSNKEWEPRIVQIGVKIDWTEERIIQEIHNVFPDAPIMERVAWCESRLKADAIGPTEDYGIFQLHDPSHDLSDVDVFDPAENIAFARKLYDESGLQPWSASKPCWSPGV